MGDSRTHNVDFDPESLRRKENVSLVKDAAPDMKDTMKMLGSWTLGMGTSIGLGLGRSEEDDEDEDIVQNMQSVTLRGGKKICRRCSSEMILEEVDDENQDDLDQDGASDGSKEEDMIDGYSKAKCVKVVIKCQCKKHMSFLKKRVGSYVLDHTAVMSRYRQYSVQSQRTSVLGASPDQPDNSPTDSVGMSSLFSCLRANSSEEDMSAHHLKTMTIAISDRTKHLTPVRIEIGLVVTTLLDESGHQRHFVQEVVPGTPAHNMELRDDDELLLLNDHLLVNATPNEMEQFFASIEIDQEFSLLTRRDTGNSTIRTIFDPQSDYEYWKIRATITVDEFEDAILAEKVHVTKAHLKNGDLLIVHEGTVTPAYIHTDAGHLQYADSRIRAGRLREEDSSFRFEMLTYPAILQTENGLVNKTIKLFRYSPDGAMPAFFYVNDAGHVKLKECPDQMHALPEMSEINRNESIGDFSVHQAIFFAHSASDVGDSYYLQSYAKQKLYLQFSTSKGRLALKRIRDEVELPYYDNILFKVRTIT